MTQTADLLVELGTEELPPKALLTLRDAFALGMEKGLVEAKLGHGAVLPYATPRRLAVLIRDLETGQPTQTIETKGPPTRLAYAEDGSPTKAAEAFANKCGVDIADLQTVSTDKGEWLFYKGEVPGKPAAALLEAIVDAALTGLPIPKRMRWGSREIEFVRPVHWLVMLLGSDVVTAEILGLKAGRETRGHRFHAPEAITLDQPGDYLDVLRTKGKVLADFAERRDIVTDGANAAAAQQGGQAIINPAVLDEVTALVEWPVPVTGSFDDKFLRLPPEVLIYTLQDHQRYFPVEKDGALLPAFITMSNLDSNEPARVRAGNERVVRPRLADAEFFFDQDSATKLADRQAALNDVVYQKGLGSLHDKSQRVGQLAAIVAASVEANESDVARAAALARTDLLTDMVGEFPSLQGRMGYYYATQDGEAETVAVAIEEQYLPRQAGDRLPATSTGKALSIADRLDTLAGIFWLGKRPSGNKDPFSLRRQALGLVRILVECGIDLDLASLLREAVALQPELPEANKQGDVAADLYDFIVDRMRAWYLDGQAPGLARGSISAEMFEAVRTRKPASLLDFHQRLAAVQGFVGHDAADSLAAANKRIANILKKAPAQPTQHVDETLFDAPEERALHTVVAELLPDHQADLAGRNYSATLERLATLRAPVDGYFDEVMVMAEDADIRSNRLAQLAQLRNLFLDVADISCLQ